MSAVGIPCGEVLGIHEALTSARAADAGMVTTQPHPVAGSMHVISPPYRIDGERTPVRRPPPVLGEGTREVLQGLLGIDSARLADLEQQGVIGPS
jgi:crotonobetainyl-CoA:carnitine CoA-transferase CaiB-like acyl-CoA transferase